MAKKKARFRELTRRSVAKAVIFRVLVIIADSVIVFLLTHRYDITIAVIIFTNLASTILYFIHERVWDRISWGRVKI